MTLMRYLLEYTLETVCHGNRSECARRMGMEYTELRKIRKRMSEGSVSNRATEALLEMLGSLHAHAEELDIRQRPGVATIHSYEVRF